MRRLSVVDCNGDHVRGWLLGQSNHWSDGVLAEGFMRRFLRALRFAALLAALGGCEDRAIRAKVDDAQWQWSNEDNQLRRCMRDHLADYQVRVTGSGAWGRLRVAVYDGETEVYTIDGHEETVLTRIGDVVFVADLNPIAMGCAVVAFDLKQRKQLWVSVLKGNSPQFHSAYRNQVILKRDGDLVVAYGKESNGRYIEFLDSRTGNSVGYKKLPPND